ncbi:hypothetical protein RP20_CCG017783 [Aedes albopictus]|nr:hypothetical protein RP20_CCG017783 [Aedes albopictus]
MAEYIRLGHCRVLSDVEDSSDGYFLPHHAILKPSSSTTKLRTVFDASAKTSSGLSLNDALMVGPTIQDSLADICLRFRIHPIVFTGDISKMYRMITVAPDQTKFQRVFWREDPSAPLKILELTTVTYGTASLRRTWQHEHYINWLRTKGMHTPGQRRYWLRIFTSTMSCLDPTVWKRLLQYARS